MPDVLVRDMDLITLNRLKEMAAKKGRSLQSEVQMILREASERDETLSELETARRIKTALRNRKQTDSVELLREDRSR